MKLFIFVALVAAATADTSVDEVLQHANDDFSARMFNEVFKNNAGKSVVISAFSVLPPLAQLSLATEGAIHDKVLRGIGIPNDNLTKSIFSDVNKNFRSVKGVELKMANKIYLANGNELNDEFAAVSRDVFSSEVKNIDFTKNQEAANEINAWVEDQTNHRIKDLVDPNSLGEVTQSVLVNAIYFKGNWKDKFNNASTKDRDFYVTKDNIVKVPTMFKNGDFRYGESEELDAKILELPYEGEESSLMVVLPNEIEGMNALVEKMNKDPSLLNKATSRMFTTEVNIYLPKFKIETKTDLKDVLSKIGLESLFDPKVPALTKFLKAESGLTISSATQKAFIEVNEEGAEAAAANEFTMVFLSASISRPRVFDANHPFIFLLKERNITMFSGVYRF